MRHLRILNGVMLTVAIFFTVINNHFHKNNNILGLNTSYSVSNSSNDRNRDGESSVRYNSKLSIKSVMDQKITNFNKRSKLNHNTTKILVDSGDGTNMLSYLYDISYGTYSKFDGSQTPEVYRASGYTKQDYVLGSNVSDIYGDNKSGYVTSSNIFDSLKVHMPYNYQGNSTVHFLSGSLRKQVEFANANNMIDYMKIKATGILTCPKIELYVHINGKDALVGNFGQYNFWEKDAGWAISAMEVGSAVFIAASALLATEVALKIESLYKAYKLRRPLNAASEIVGNTIGFNGDNIVNEEDMVIQDAEQDASNDNGDDFGQGVINTVAEIHPATATQHETLTDNDSQTNIDKTDDVTIPRSFIFNETMPEGATNYEQESVDISNDSDIQLKSESEILGDVVEIREILDFVSIDKYYKDALLNDIKVGQETLDNFVSNRPQYIETMNNYTKMVRKSINKSNFDAKSGLPFRGVRISDNYVCNEILNDFEKAHLFLSNPKSMQQLINSFNLELDKEDLLNKLNNYETSVKSFNSALSEYNKLLVAKNNPDIITTSYNQVKLLHDKLKLSKDALDTSHINFNQKIKSISDEAKWINSLSETESRQQKWFLTTYKYNSTRTNSYSTYREWVDSGDKNRNKLDVSYSLGIKNPEFMHMLFVCDEKYIKIDEIQTWEKKSVYVNNMIENKGENVFKICKNSKEYWLKKGNQLAASKIQTAYDKFIRANNSFAEQNTVDTIQATLGENLAKTKSLFERMNTIKNEVINTDDPDILNNKTSFINEFNQIANQIDAIHHENSPHFTKLKEIQNQFENNYEEFLSDIDRYIIIN